jgi:hypothetical protein
VRDDHDLRSRLERIASSAGDPPEHGLERIAARRHRRLRRRRGAVATAAVLAVLATSISLIVEGTERRDAVTASRAAKPEGAPAEVPRTVEVRCEPSGIVVPVASVRTQRDGLHIRVHNSLATETTLQVRGGGWFSGDIPVAQGVREVRQPVPPGDLTVGCEIGGEFQRRQVNLVDPAGYYVEPALECDDGGMERLRDITIDPAQRTLVGAVREGMSDHLAGGTTGDAIRAPRGYPAQKLSDATDDPTVQVERDGKVVALAHVRGEGGAPEEPWVMVARADVCVSVLAAAADEGPSDEDTTSTTTGASGDTDPTATTAAP